MDHQTLIPKLRKVLALTTSPVEGEAQAAAEMLARLLERHNLEIADLEKRGQAKPGVRENSHDLGKAAFKWKLKLADCIADHYYCHSLTDWKANTVAFVGRPDNVEALQMLYGWLIDQVRRIAGEERYVHINNTGEHIDPLRWQCGFGDGAAERLGERLKELRKQQSSEAGDALVLSHRSEVSDWLEEHRGYRIDGKRTKRQREANERYEEYRAKEEKMAKLRKENYSEYIKQRPWDTDEERARREKEDEKWRKKEERNRRRRERRRGQNGYYTYKKPSADEIRKEDQKLRARARGKTAANRINLEPFLEAGKSQRPNGLLN